MTGLASTAMSLVSGFGVQVAVGDSFQGPGRRRDLGLGRLEDRGPSLSAREREGGADVVDRVFRGQPVGVGEPGGEIAVPLGSFLDLAEGLLDGSRGGRLAVVIMLFALGCLLVACRGVEFGLACAVGVAHCLIARGQRFQPGRLVVLAAAAGRAGFGVGASRCQVRVAGDSAGLAELADGRQQRPGIAGAGCTEAEELPVSQVPDVPGLVVGEGGAGLVPGGAQVRAAGERLGSDRVVGVVVAGQLAVGADRGGLALPVQAGGGVVRGVLRAAIAQGRVLAAACSPMRRRRSSMAAASWMRNRRRPGSSV